MDPEALINAGSGLMGALIGAAAAITTQWLGSRSQQRRDDAAERKTAIQEVLVHALAIDLRAQEVSILAVDVGSLGGLVNRMAGSVAAVDLLAVFDRLNADVLALQRAAAQVWLFGDSGTVILANAVVRAANDVVEAHYTSSHSRLRRTFRVAILGKRSHDLDLLETRRRALSTARQALTRHTRAAFDLEEVDPFAGT